MVKSKDQPKKIWTKKWSTQKKNKSSNRSSNKSKGNRRNNKKSSTKSKQRRKSTRKNRPATSPNRFVTEMRDPRTPGRAFDPYTPVQVDGKIKGKGKKHIVATTPGGGMYYCGDISSATHREGETRDRWHRRNLHRIKMSLRLCEKEKAFRRRESSVYEARSNRMWRDVVHALMRRYTESLAVLGLNLNQNRFLKRLRLVFGNETTNRKLFGAF